MYDGYLNSTLGDGGYKAPHRGAPRLINERMTPNFELKEGQRYGLFIPAPYLPAIRVEQINLDPIVIAAGKPVCLDSHGYVVPAGYKLMTADNSPVYTALDVANNVRKLDGTPVVAGTKVFNAISGVKFGRAFGVASYDTYMQPNENPFNPATYFRNNYNRQNGISVLTNYVLQFPIQANKENIQFAGMTVFADSTVVPGDLVTYNADSNFVVYKVPTIGAIEDVKKAIEGTFEVLGTVSFVDKEFPKQMLDRVKTAYDTRLYSEIKNADGSAFDELNKLPGSANDGVPHVIQYAGGDLTSGVVSFKLQM